MSGYTLAVHGGAGDHPRRTIGAAAADQGLAAIRASLHRGAACLREGGSALTAVVCAVQVLEDSGALNAGRGAVLRADGGVQLDAAVADGATRRAGAVAAVRTVPNPVLAAAAVLAEGASVLLVGEGAEAFAATRGLGHAPPGWFRRMAVPSVSGVSEAGTVGAAAFDGHGHLAAATSTGGLTGSTVGRVGDSPLVGAGTWADDRSVAVSATGGGEAFIRAAFAHHVHAGVLLGGCTVATACERALAEVDALGGDGGCVAVGADGRVVMPFSSAAMFRGWTDARGEVRVGLEPGEVGE
jgi:beta-aspartyl-peptidase (threonine type)